MPVDDETISSEQVSSVLLPSGLFFYLIASTIQLLFFYGLFLWLSSMGHLTLT